MTVGIHKKDALATLVFVALVPPLIGSFVFDVSYRFEMVIKILIISMALLLIPKIKFGILRVPILLMLSLAVVLTSSIFPAGKSFSRTAVVCALLILLFAKRYRYLSVAIVVAPLWIVQDAIRSRALEFSILILFLQIIMLRFYKVPFLILTFIFVYLSGMMIVGHAFYLGDYPIHPSASNVARSTMVYSILVHVPEFPFGYKDLASYNTQLSLYMPQMFSHVYNDPHNLFLSALVWGGLPLFLIVTSTFYFGVYKKIQQKVHLPEVLFAGAALVVFCSTSTLSMANVLFFLFLIYFIAHGARQTEARLH